ncbi:cysteinyl-tRNA synthetase [Methylophilaceae bacterium]|nr:cysteinyl-tRNA synthetase [Methylophilaceae bacterium]
MLRIYNSIAREKQDFIPITAGKASMYVCGMTVYDYCHLGHARVMVVFDMVNRWLRASGFDVTYVRNITDIDDKIISRANEREISIQELTNEFIQAMDEDSAKLGVMRPDIEPRATAHIADMLTMIGRLIEKGHAYPADNGDVFYSVNSFEGYGKLSGKSLEDLRAGERVEIDAFKRDPMDFVLWKAAKPNEPSYDSPWGKGRPGWHIECSAMGAHHLGKHFDIHGGGQDLQFPHHENEIAQSEGAHDCKFVNYWMHNGFVRVDDEKMSKSLGNFFTIREVLKKYKAEVVRFFILRAQYRSPLNYSDKHLDDANQALTRLYTALKNVPPAQVAIDWAAPFAARFKAAMDDDFNTPEAMAVLFDLASEANRSKSAEVAGQLKALGNLMGLLEESPEAFLQGDVSDTGLPGPATHDTAGALVGDGAIPAGTATHFSKEDINNLIASRLEAKKSRNFAEADRIRKELSDQGIILEDSPQGTTWRRA